MCALFGWLDYKHILPIRTLKKLTQALANAAEERGTDASGISYIKNGNIIIFKRPKPAHKVKFHLPDNTPVVMGHTRFATQGSEKLNHNNHPFYGHADVNFAFAHNGVLHNDAELRTSEKLPVTKIETDSYIGVQLLENEGHIDFDSLKAMAEKVRGSFVFTILSQNQTLYFVKGNNPLCLLCFEQLGIYIYASTWTILAKALKMVGLDKMPHTEIAVNEGDILSIDRLGNISKSTFKPHFNSFFHMPKSIFDDEEDWYCGAYNEHEELLLESCRYYGVDEDDVMMLLDYGYTADEIEDMFCDHNLMQTALKSISCEDDFWDFLVGT